MNLAGIQSGMVGMALFDAWDAAFKKTLKCHGPKGSPLVAAAAEAFERYIEVQEIGFAAQIAGTAIYALHPKGTCITPVTTQQMAPFLALNIMA